MQQVGDWVMANWPVVVLTTLWILVNVYPRPHPDELSGLERLLWSLADRLSVLTARSVPGRVKWLFARSPGRDDSATGPPPDGDDS